MNESAEILIVGADAADVAMVQSQLSRHFESIAISKGAAGIISDFDRVQPEVLVFAYRKFQDGKESALEILRHSRFAHEIKPQIVSLCRLEDVKAAVELCRRDTFNDYVHYWPTPQDPLRLVMSVHLALQRWNVSRAAESMHEIADTLESNNSIALDKDGGKQKSSWRLLVVEDEAFQRSVLSGIFKNSGVELEFAENRREVFQSLRRVVPDVILMDINFPGDNGIEITREIKTSKAYCDIPIVMMTAESEKDAVVRSRAAGANKYIAKPIKREKLYERLEEYLEGLGL